MNKIFGKNIQQNKGMMNTKFRVVVTSGGGVENEGIMKGPLGDFRGLGNILFLKKG